MSKFNIIATQSPEHAEEIAKQLDMPTFSHYRHVFIQSEDKGLTLSVDFHGVTTTLSFVPRDDSSPECMDVRVHHQYGSHKNCNDVDVPNQACMIFEQGRGKRETTFDLLAVLLNPEYLN